MIDLVHEPSFEDQSLNIITPYPKFEKGLQINLNYVVSKWSIGGY